MALNPSSVVIGAECFPQLMETLNKSFGLWIVCSSVGGLDPKKAVEFRQMTGKLRATVRGNVIWYCQVGYPVTDEGVCTCLGGVIM